MADLVTRKLHILIYHILKRFKPRDLKGEIRKIVAWVKNGDFKKKGFPAFVSRLGEESRTLQK